MPDSNLGPLSWKSGALPMSHHISSKPPHHFIFLFAVASTCSILMYSAHLPFRASAPTRHNQRLNEQPKDPRKEACLTKEGIPAMPRAKPEGGNQAGNQPMRKRLGRQDYSNLKTNGTRTGIPDHSCPPLLPLPHPPPPTPPNATQP